MGLLLYFVFVLESLKNMMIFFTVMLYISCAIAWIIIWIRYMGVHESYSKQKEKQKAYDKDYPMLKKISIKLLVISIIFHIVTTIIPTSKQAAMIYVLPKIAKNKDMKQIPANIAKLANEGLKELIKITTDEAKEKIKE